MYKIIESYNGCIIISHAQCVLTESRRVYKITVMYSGLNSLCHKQQIQIH